MNTLLIILVLCLLPANLILILDFLLAKLRILSHFHIGRWDSDEQWGKAVEHTAEKWLRNTPRVSQSDHVAHSVLSLLMGESGSATIQAWQTAGLALGLAESPDGRYQEQLQNWCDLQINSEGEWKNLVDRVDMAMLAYAVLKIHEDPECIEIAMDAVISILEKNQGEDKTFSYSQGSTTHLRYVDTLGMICPFLARYGRIYGKHQYIEYAFNQLQSYHDHALLLGSNLPCHAYDMKAMLPVGVYGWGRGTAWYLIGLIDTWEELPEGAEKMTVLTWIREAAESYSQFQKVNGGFETLLQGGGRYDSSATAVMAYFYAKCGAIFSSEEYRVISERCLGVLKQVTMKNGAIDLCQGDTHGIGIFSRAFDIMPFAQGFALRTLHVRNKERK